jgi:cobalt-zinc-cadmium efflux system protein
MGAIAIEAIQRFRNPTPVSGITVIGVALVGIVINGVTAFLFMSGRERDLNIKGAFLHMAGDALVSVGVVIAGIAILTTGWLWFDPIVSLIIVVVIVVSTWNLLRDAVNLALDAVPEEIDPQAVRTYLSELSGVAGIHDLHIWAMSTTETALTAHLVMLTGNPGDAFLSCISRELHDKFGIEHSTIQVETGNSLHPCEQKSCCD